MKNALKELGLIENEANTYLTLLKLGTTPASTIAHKLKIPRSTAKYTCDQLVLKRLVTSVTKANTVYYSPEPPSKLEFILNEQKIELKKREEKLKEVISELEELQDPHNVLPKIQYYEGEDIFRGVLEKMENEHVVSFGAGDYFKLFVPKTVDEFRNKIKKQNVLSRVIRAPKYKDLHKNDHSRTKSKYFNIFDEFKVDIQIAADKVSILSVAQKSPVGILITHKEIAEAFSQIFEELWAKLEK